MSVRHEVLVGAVALGTAQECGWLETPLRFDLPGIREMLKADGGVRPGRDRAVLWALGLADRAGGWRDADDRETARQLLADAYDLVVVQVGSYSA